MTGEEWQLQQLACSVALIREGRESLPAEPAPAEPAEPVIAGLDDTEMAEPEGIVEGQDCQVHLLASGSKGNAAFIRCGTTQILIDAGISYRRISKGLERSGTSVDQLDAVFITHEHSDHVAGLPMLLKHSHMPVYTTLPTWQGIGRKIEGYEDRFVRLTRRVGLGDMQVVPFSISHDAARPVGYTMYGGGCKVTLATDLGYVSPDVEAAASYADILILEANHDEDMLRNGPYPYMLQQRILGTRGHLSNRAAADLLTRLPRRNMMKIVLAHRSEKNNTPALSLQTLRSVLQEAGVRIGQDVLLRLACQKGQVRFENKE